MREVYIKGFRHNYGDAKCRVADKLMRLESAARKRKNAKARAAYLRECGIEGDNK